MARMYPPYLPEGVKSPGETEIFRQLRDDPLTSQWAVFYSLDIASHVRQIAGEIDFVVVVPTKGVLCLEVKATRNIRRSGGAWYYGQNTAPDFRGPFKQVADGMHSLRRHLVQQDAGLSGIVFWSAAVFPYVEFDLQSPEWHPWQVVDSRPFTSKTMGQIVLDILDRARKLLAAKPGIRWFDPGSRQPDAAQCKQITALLRHDFEFFERPAARAQNREAELKRYTEEQFEALDAMQANPRVFFTGPAGTGKTLLAIEAARRACDDGRKVLLVCYNKLLSTWLKEQVSGLQPAVAAGTLHSYMLSLAGCQPPEEASPVFWERELPAKAIEALLADGSDLEPFDELIVDEAQDIARDDYFDVLDLCLKGGLSAGRWRCFGDFEKQSIFSPVSGAAQTAEQRLVNAPRYTLRVNCRNTPRIAEMVHLLGGLTPRYTRIRRPDNGIEPDIRPYRTVTDQKKLLSNELSRLQTEGFAGRDVVILSPHAGTACAAASLGGDWQRRIRPFNNLDVASQIVRYCSVYAFKGLEAPAVIVTDVETVGADEALSLFYVAITRALERLVILVHENARQQMLSALAGSGTAKGAAHA
jgi:hypothetical protein